MDMLLTARQNRIKALNALERKRTGEARTQRPGLGVAFSRPVFRTTRFDFQAPFLLT